MRVPIGPAVSLTGGYWLKVYDDLFDCGYDTGIVNAAAGSLSMLIHPAGYAKYRTASTGYYARRAPVSAGDRGYVGDVMSPDGTSYWVCTTGNTLYAFNSGPRTIGEAGFGPAYADYVSSLPAIVPGGSPVLQNLVTAATVPAFPDSVGVVVSDGGIVWQCIATTTPRPTPMPARY